jgi:signal peptidase I
MLTKKKPRQPRQPAPKKSNRKAKSAAREWWDAIVFAVVAATLIRWLIFTPYTIPTGSMERSLLVGDFLVVSKLHYGAATPITPLQIPLTHQTIWGTNIRSYVDWIQLPQLRLPGFSSIKRNDVVVFNYPAELEHPIDLRMNYIKRCVALPGDRLEIREQQLWVNGAVAENPELLQFMYYIRLEGSPSERFIRQYALYDAQRWGDGLLVSLPPATAREISGLPFVKAVDPYVFGQEEKGEGILPEGYDALAWNLDHFGPLLVPAKGMTIPLTAESLALYFRTIKYYEGYDPEAVVLSNGVLYLNGQPLSDYTFQQNYYFMMGDNRHNSLDSRYWGFVPHDHIVGKALFTWMSLDQNASGFSKIRWERIFRGIK